MLQLIIFDCDGVMFDSRTANRLYYNQLLAHFGRPEMDEEEVAYVHMHNAKNSVEHIFRRFSDQDMDTVASYCKSLDYSPFFRFMQMEKDLIEFLEYAKTRYHLAISTNRTTTLQSLLKKFNLLQYFGKIMTAENSPKPKPAPDALYEILKHFNCQVDEAIYIGDSIIDRQHTKAAGIRLIAFKNPDLPAEFHVSSFMQICALPPFRQ